MIARRSFFLLPTLLALAALPAVTGSAHAASVFQPDTAFGDVGTTILGKASKGRNISINAIAARPGGGWIAVGNTDSPGNDRENTYGYRWSVVAFGRDGKIDRKFGNDGRLIDLDPGRLAYNGSVADAVAVQPDGKILVGGLVDVPTGKDTAEYFDSVGGDPECSCQASRGAFLVARLRTDGKLDRSFGTRGYVRTGYTSKTWTENIAEGRLKQIVVAPNGRIYLLGDSAYYENPNTNYRNLLIGFGLKKDGSVNRSFGVNGRTLAGVGAASHSFYADKFVWLKRGGIAVSGSTLAGKGRPPKSEHIVTARITTSGRLDRRYNRSGWRELSFAPAKTKVVSVELDSSGAATYPLQRYRGNSLSEGTPDGVIVSRLNKKGQFDRAFGQNGVVELSKSLGSQHRGATGLLQFADGSMIAKTWTGSYEGTTPGSVVPISRSGSVGVPYSITFQNVASAVEYSGPMLQDGDGFVFTALAPDGNRDPDVDERYSAVLGRVRAVTPSG